MEALAEFFAIDQDLIAAAAETSPSLTATQEPLKRWVALLPEAERNAFLVQVARGETHVGIRLLRRLREVGGTKPTSAATTARRTFAEIQAGAERQEQLRVHTLRQGSHIPS